VVLICRVLGLCRQAYYRWLKSPCSERDLLDAYLTNAALTRPIIFTQSLASPRGVGPAAVTFRTSTPLARRRLYFRSPIDFPGGVVDEFDLRRPGFIPQLVPRLPIHRKRDMVIISRDLNHRRIPAHGQRLDLSDLNITLDFNTCLSEPSRIGK